MDFHLDMCLDIVEVWFGIAIGYTSSVFDIVISQWNDNGGVLWFHVFIWLSVTFYTVIS